MPKPPSITIHQTSMDEPWDKNFSRKKVAVTISAHPVSRRTAHRGTITRVGGSIRGASTGIFCDGLEQYPQLMHQLLRPLAFRSRPHPGQSSSLSKAGDVWKSDA